MSEIQKTSSPIWVCVLAGFGIQYIVAVPLSIWAFGVDGLTVSLPLLLAQIIVTIVAWFYVAHWFDRRDKQLRNS